MGGCILNNIGIDQANWGFTKQTDIDQTHLGGMFAKQSISGIKLIIISSEFCCIESTNWNGSYMICHG